MKTSEVLTIAKQYLRTGEELDLIEVEKAGFICLAVELACYSGEVLYKDRSEAVCFVEGKLNGRTFRDYAQHFGLVPKGYSEQTLQDARHKWLDQLIKELEAKSASAEQVSAAIEKAESK